MSFSHPAFLWLALLAIPELLLSRLRFGRLRIAVAALVGPRRRDVAVGDFANASFLGSAAAALCLLCFAVCLAGPSWGSRGSAAERSGVEAVFVLDVSRSMLVRDVPPDRLEAAKSLIREIIHATGSNPEAASLRATTGGRAGAASFALVADKGDAVLLSPMTEDVDSIDSALDYADPDTLTSPGTDIERGLQVGIAAFSANSASDRLLILFSDGGELSGAMSREAEALRLAHVRFLAVGIGSGSPAFVPGPGGSPVLLSNGLPAKSALQADRLRGFAAAAGGRYLDGSEPGTPGALGQELTEARRSGTRVETRSVDRSSLAAGFALLFLLAAILADMAAVRARGSR
ncbi:MAG TPA: VWA domain-containing protein [Rectinemataceae bacterium]|nr:VWA domain-containing protein [Rectinemataceae bacterium]